MGAILVFSRFVVVAGAILASARSISGVVDRSAKAAKDDQRPLSEDLVMRRVARDMED